MSIGPSGDAESATGDSPAAYYIDPVHGSDSNNGLSPTTAWKSARNIVTYYGEEPGQGYDPKPAGWVELQPGDEVHFLPGDYTDVYFYSPYSNDRYQSLYFVGLHGTPEAPIRFIAEPGVRLTPRVPETGFEMAGAKFQWCANIKFEGFEITATFGDGLSIQRCSGVEIAGNWIHDVTGKNENNIAGLSVELSVDVNIHDNLLHDNYDRTVGLDSYQNCREIVLFKNEGPVRVHHNKFFHTPNPDIPDVGLAVGLKHAAWGPTEIDHNIFVNSWYNSVATSGSPNVRVHHNLFVDSDPVDLAFQNYDTTFQDVVIDHNTQVCLVDGTNRGGGLSYIPDNTGHPIGPVSYRNNLIVDRRSYNIDRQAISVGTYSGDNRYEEVVASGSLDIDNNAYWNPNTALQFGLFACNGDQYGVDGDLYDWTQWQSMGYDVHGFAGDPQLNAAFVPAEAAAQSAGWYAGDVPRLTVLFSNDLVNAGQTASGTITRSGAALDAALSVTLRSSDPRLADDTTVVIPARQSTASFQLVIGAGSYQTGLHIAQFSASAAGFSERVDDWLRVQVGVAAGAAASSGETAYEVIPAEPAAAALTLTPSSELTDIQDGGAAGPSLPLDASAPTVLKDIFPGSASSFAWNLTEVNGILYFTAQDFDHGKELWRSDGTAEGTRMVADLWPGAEGSIPWNLVSVNGTLFFVATDPDHGRELWKLGPTDPEPVLVKDIRPGVKGSEPRELTNVAGTICFSADDSVVGRELWRSDGTPEGTELVRDFLPGGGSSVPRFLANIGGGLYFFANSGLSADASGTRYGLWKSDGTSDGTELVKTLPEESNEPPRHLVDVNGMAYFVIWRSESPVQWQLWRSDGTEAGTIALADIGGTHETRPWLTNVNGTLYFARYVPDGGPGSLWKSNGTPRGTGPVALLSPGRGGANPAWLTDYNGTLYYAADDAAGGRSLWMCTAAGAKPVGGAAGAALDPRDMTVVNGTMYFAAFAPHDRGRELWKTDGTANGTMLVADLAPGPDHSNPHGFVALNGGVAFAAKDAMHGFELWTMTDAVSDVWSLPPRRSGYNVLLRRIGGEIELTDKAHPGQPLFRMPAGAVPKLTIRGLDGLADSLTIDYSFGGFAFSEGLVFDGGGGKGADALLIKGTAGTDAVAIGAEEVLMNGAVHRTIGVERLTLNGGAGDDAYQVSDLTLKTTIFDSGGADLLDFSQATTGLNITLALASPQKVFAPANATTLSLKGTIENVIGSPQDDFIRGNGAANEIWGYAGNDTIYGGSGNDVLFGGEGDDSLYGDAGDDVLFGESGNNVLVGGAGSDILDVLANADAAGRNLLIGGLGADTLQGGPGEDIPIGGTTRYDGKAAALAAVMQEWSTAKSFQERCDSLDIGFRDPKAGFIQLRPKTKSNPKGTVLDDSAADQVFGGPGSDWFFAFAKDVTEDFSPDDR